MRLSGPWRHWIAFCLGLMTLWSGAATASDGLIVLVGGTKEGSVPVSPAKPMVVREPTATVVAANASDAAKPTAKPARQLTELDKLVDEAILVTSRRYLTAEVHTPWQIFHGLIALRHNFKLKVAGQKTSALEWVRAGQHHKGLPLVEQTPYGARFHPFTEPYAFEGHPNQFMAILSMAELPRNFTLKAGDTGAIVTVDDMLKNAQMECNDREEITWTLWLFARYFPIETQWQNKYGENWSMERLVQIQTNQRVQDGACGGCHGLFALSLARNAYLQSGRQLQGTWFEADQKLKRFVAETKALQNGDGSFSSSHYNGPGYAPDFTPRISASGHILEWLMIGLDNQELQQDWLQRGVQSVARDLVTHRQAPADCGPLYHALHSLVLYRQRTRPDIADATLVEAPVAPKAPTPVSEPKGEYTEPQKVEPKVTKPATTESAPPAPPMPESKPMPEAVAPTKQRSESELKKTEVTAPATAEPKAEPLFGEPKPMPTEPAPKAEVKPEVKAETKPTTEKPKKDDNDEFDGEFQTPLPPTDD